jgi:hypothetical protein
MMQHASLVWRARVVFVISFSSRGLNHTARDTFLGGNVSLIKVKNEFPSELRYSSYVKIASYVKIERIK